MNLDLVIANLFADFNMQVFSSLVIILAGVDFFTFFGTGSVQYYSTLQNILKPQKRWLPAMRTWDVTY